MFTINFRTRGILRMPKLVFSILSFLLLIVAPNTPGQEESPTPSNKPSLVTFPPDELKRLNQRLAEKQKSLFSKEPVDPSVGSNGCGPEWLMTLLTVLPQHRRDRYKAIANKRTFIGWDSKLNVIIPFPVDFQPACDLHDAGYAGLFVTEKWPAEGISRTVDFSSWTKDQIDEKFHNDLRNICDRKITSSGEARAKCKGWSGAQLYHELVSTVGYVSFDCNLNDSIVTKFSKVPPQLCTRKYTKDGWFIPAD
jgi:hypothetical protein